MISKYLTSIVKPCVFKLFSLRKITKSNFFHHLPTLNIANLFMQSFASPPPLPIPSPSPTPPQKSRTTIHATPPHRKGATIASPQEKFVKICANSWLKTTNTDSTNHTNFLLNLLNSCEPQTAHKSGDSCEEKRLRGWGGYHFLRSLSLKKTIAISYDFFVLMMNTKAAAITR